MKKDEFFDKVKSGLPYLAIISFAVLIIAISIRSGALVDQTLLQNTRSGYIYDDETKKLVKGVIFKNSQGKRVLIRKD